MTDTIFALATPPGRGAVAVIRVSGSTCSSVLETLCGHRPQPRRATLRTIRDAGGAALDRALVLWFPGPASFTGEDSVEFHLHGGTAVIDGVTLALIAAGARLAHPGEFTRRAFENGKLDLAQAEAVADLVDAETTAQARQALDQMDGGLTRLYARWRVALISALGLLEASVDFPEDDASSQRDHSAALGLRRLLEELRSALHRSGRGRVVRDGYQIALIGAPNAGKSSLINLLSGRDAAIVDAAPGTTRDIVEVTLTVAGYRVLLSDTAGLRQADNAVEAEGARRAQAAGGAAALRLWVIDRSANFGDWRAARPLIKPGDFCILNKSDVLEGSDGAEARDYAVEQGLDVIDISATGDDGTDLWKALEHRVVAELSGADFPAATRARHTALLQAAVDHIARGLCRLGEPELAAEDIRLAARSLERVTGKVGVEDVLDRVFSTFCIGK